MSDVAPQAKKEEIPAVSEDRLAAIRDQEHRLRDLAKDWTNAKGYVRRYRPETAEGLDAGWRELLIEAETSHRLLDMVARDGGPQALGAYGDAAGDIDSRVASVVLRLIHAEGFLNSIANAHDRERAGGGMVGDFCIECERRWPCPTYQWANGDRDMNDSWEGSDDD